MTAHSYLPTTKVRSKGERVLDRLASWAVLSICCLWFFYTKGFCNKPELYISIPSAKVRVPNHTSCLVYPGSFRLCYIYLWKENPAAVDTIPSFHQQSGNSRKSRARGRLPTASFPTENPSWPRSSPLAVMLGMDYLFRERYSGRKALYWGSASFSGSFCMCHSRALQRTE